MKYMLLIAGDEKTMNNLPTVGDSGMSAEFTIEPQAAANDLLAQQLTAEGAHAKDVRDTVGVPAFRQHRDGDDAAGLFAGPTNLPDCGDQVAQCLCRLVFRFSLFGLNLRK